MWGGVASDNVVGMGIDDDGDIYVVGETRDEGWLAPTNGTETYAVKYTAEGEAVWERQYRPAGDVPPPTEAARSVVFMPDGSFRVVASFGDLWTLATYDEDGERVATIGGMGFRDIRDMLIVDSHIYLAGSEFQSIDGVSFSYGVVAKYDLMGNQEWSQVIGQGETARTTAAAVELGASGDVIVVGFSTSSLGSENAGDYDGFLQKYSPDGVLLSTELFGTDGRQNFNEMIAQPSGIYILGTDFQEHPADATYETADTILLRLEE